MTRSAYVLEQGNGWPGVGDYVQRDGAVYRVVSSTGHIMTHFGPPNRIAVELVSADWSEFEGDPFPCSVTWPDA